MTGSVAAVCRCEGYGRSFLQIRSLDRHRTSCVYGRCKPHIHVCKRLVGRDMLHRPVRYRHVCNSSEPDWDAEMSLFRKRTMKPNQMETVRRLEEEVDTGKVRTQSTPINDLIHVHVCMVSAVRVGVVLGGWSGHIGGVKQRRPGGCISSLCKWSVWVGAYHSLLTHACVSST